MERITKNRAAFFPNPSHRPAAMAMHRASHAIAKPKPKIRIIHIFAPEIITTDAANFRELVQRLTGKPTEKDGKKKNKPAETPARMSPETGEVCRSLKKEEEEEEEEGMWNGFPDLEGFIRELGEFPLLPLESSHQIMHGLEETQFG